jgi:hypothetical protein
MGAGAAVAAGLRMASATPNLGQLMLRRSAYDSASAAAAAPGPPAAPAAAGQGWS